MFRWSVLALSFLMFAAISPGQTVPKDAKKQSVQGRVIEAKSGQPIRKVNVEVMGGAGQSFTRHSAVTNADGTFTLEGLTPGRYMVTLERPGFVQTTKSQAQMTFTLNEGQNLTGLLFHMQTAGVISGRIVDADGDPMAGVSVNATPAGTRGVGFMRINSGANTTNDLGEYRIADLRPGKYLVSATPASGMSAPLGEKEKGQERNVYTSTYYPGTLDKTRAVEVEVRSGGEAIANFAALMTRAFHVSGTVIGVPSGAIVRVFLGSKNSVTEMGEPQELTEGSRFDYQNLAPGTYVGMMMVVKGLNEGKPDMQMVRLSPPIEVDKADVEGVQLQAEPGGQVRGRFQMDTSEKFDWTQLNVSLQPVEENVSETLSGFLYSGRNTFSQLGHDGTFEMKNVPAGAYQLAVGSRSGNLRDYYTKSVKVGGRESVDSGFTVNGDLSLDVVISAKGAAVEGNVVNSKGQPAAYSMVIVGPNSDHRMRPDSYQQESGDEHGHFVVRGLNPGSYVVLAFEDLRAQGDDIRQPEFFKTYRAKAEKIELEEGSRKSVTVKVIPAETETN